MIFNKINLDKPETVTFSIGQFLDSIERNGIEQTKATYWNYLDNGDGTVTISSACAMGQAAANLGVDWALLEEGMNYIKLRNGFRLIDGIIGKNDREGWDYKKIANYYRERLSTRLEEQISFETTIKYTPVQ